VASVAAHKGKHNGKHDGKHDGNHHSGMKPHAGGRPAFVDKYFRTCHADKERLCPDFHPQGPMRIKQVFESECFKTHEQELSPECLQMVTEWRADQASLHDVTPIDEPQEPSDSEQGNNNEGGDSKPEDDDENDNDDGDKTAQGTHFYEACHEDRVTLCPELPDDVSPHDFFENRCARNPPGVSDKCMKYYKKWREARMAVFGILVSSTFVTMFGGLLGCLALCCCVACCVKAKRTRMRRRRVAKTLPVSVPQKKADPAAEPLHAAISEEFGMPMQTFPPGAAYSPYSYPPQYWQPVLFVPPQADTKTVQ